MMRYLPSLPIYMRNKAGQTEGIASMVHRDLYRQTNQERTARARRYGADELVGTMKALLAREDGKRFVKGEGSPNLAGLDLVKEVTWRFHGLFLPHIIKADGRRWCLSATMKSNPSQQPIRLLCLHDIKRFPACSQV